MPAALQRRIGKFIPVRVNCITMPYLKIDTRRITGFLTYTAQATPLYKLTKRDNYISLVTPAAFMLAKCQLCTYMQSPHQRKTERWISQRLSSQ